MLYFAYLDEFGHVGPYVTRTDPRHNTSPVFGLGGIVLPYGEVRAFATWFYQLKCRLLADEIERDGRHPATWEKKGSALYTTRNVLKYPELRRATNRILSKVKGVEGAVFYTGIQKTLPPERFGPQRLYLATLDRALRQLNALAAERDAKMLIVMDQHQERDALLTAAAKAMYRTDYPRRHIVEPPFQVESHRYQTCQCADWICGLVGRLGAYRARPDEHGDLDWAERYFGVRIAQAAVRSGIRLQPASAAEQDAVTDPDEIVATLPLGRQAAPEDE